MNRKALSVSLAVCVFASVVFAGSTGKITGTIVDARTKEKLVAVNVLIEGTNRGATTNPDGFYVILNVPSGTYKLRATLLGYSGASVIDVRVIIDQTTTVDFEMTESSISQQEVVVVAQRPVVQRDVSNSVTNIDVDQMRNLPVGQVANVIGLQAGVQGLSIRGGSLDQTAFVVDGLTLRDERNNSPFTSVSMLAVQDVQIQTGGFNAEYGNIRSGQINVVTREGGLQSYHVGLMSRYRPASRKHFGDAPNAFDSYLVRPYLDDAVCWTGTKSGAWDIYTQRQYVSFVGWNKISSDLLKDNDPSNDLSPEACREVWMWQHRKDLDARRPDYDVNFVLGGPVPGGSYLGDLRFFASFQQNYSQYIVPMATPGLTDISGSVKLTSDVGKGMKLMAEYVRGKNQGTSFYRDGTYGVFTTPGGMANSLDNRNFIDARMFGTDYWPISDVYRDVWGLKFTHMISGSTYYELSMQQFWSTYRTYPSRGRDTSRAYQFGSGYYIDEAPFGWADNPPLLNGIDGMLMGYTGGWDTSRIVATTLRGDFSSQLDKYNQVKTGVEFVTTNFKEKYGSIDNRLPDGNTLYRWDKTPLRFSAYLQDKLEFEGMVANIGLRFEAVSAGGDWYQWKAFDPAFDRGVNVPIDTLVAQGLLKKASTQVITSLSPRLGVAFPISENAKLFFNYGHFRSIPQPEDQFLVSYNLGKYEVNYIANPNLPLPKTIAYECGYEQSIAEQFLLRASAYYKDISDERQSFTYVGTSGNYSTVVNTAYGDIRGFEFTVEKNRGDWVRGFMNYTYMVSSSGYFGKTLTNQDATAQQIIDRTNYLDYQPIPKPYARANIDLFTPDKFGPEFASIYPLGDLRLNILASWSAGDFITWTGGGSATNVQNNLQWRSTWGCDIRVSKSFRIAGVETELFADLFNVFNLKQMTNYNGVPLGVSDINDYYDYMRSLHLPESGFVTYGHIPGDDRPGDYRKNGVEFQPMEFTRDIASVSSPSTRAIYWDLKTRTYYKYVGGSWQTVPQSTINKVIDDKAYIDMPNETYFTFLNPRNIFFGIRVSVDL